MKGDPDRDKAYAEAEAQQHDGPSLLPCPHEYGPSRVGHGEAQCKWCLGTNRENAIIAPNYCQQRAERDPAFTRPTQPQADDRAEIVRWLRAQSDKGAEVGIAAGKETTRRAAFGGGSLALHRAADAIERGEHLIDNIADRLANGETESQQPQAEGLVEEALALVREQIASTDYPVSEWERDFANKIAEPSEEMVERVGKAIEKAIWTDNQVYWSMERGVPFPATTRNALARATLAALSSPDR